MVSCWKLNRRAPRARVARRASAWSSCKAVLRLIQWWVLEKMIITCAGGVAGFSVEQVEEVRMVVRMLPIFFTTIFFWTIYSQARS